MTFELDLYHMTQRAKYQGQRSSTSKIILRTDKETRKHTHTHTRLSDCSTRTTIVAVANDT